MLFVGVAILLLSIATVTGWIANKPSRKLRPSVVELPFVETQAVNLSNNHALIDAGGFVSAKTTANITPQVSGKIIALSPRLLVGEQISKGEVIIQLDKTDYNVALANAKASLAIAKATLARENASLAGAKASLAGAKAQLASAKASLITAKSNYEQAQGQSRQAERDVKHLGLKATRLNLKKPQLAAAKAAVTNANASIDSAKASEKSVKAQVESATASVASANAQLQRAKAQLELAMTNVARTTITAPFDAVVQNSDAAVGEMAGNSKVLATLVATDAYTVQLTLGAQAIRLVAVGDTVTLADSAYGSTYHAMMTRFAPGFDQQNRTLSAYVDIEHPLQYSQPLLLQSYLNGVIQGKTIANSTYIPNSAIVDNTYVWGKRADDTITVVPVSVVHRGQNESLVTFESNIAALVTRVKDSFVEGQKVTTSRTATKQPKRQEQEEPQHKPSSKPPQSSSKQVSE